MIDIHTHPVMIKELMQDDPSLLDAVRDIFGLHVTPQPLATFLLQMDVAGVEQAVLLPVDCSTAHDCCIVSNEQVAELVASNPRFIGFASVDPHRPEAPRALERAIKQLGLRGLKLDPALQGFYPNDRECAYPLYDLCCELDIPVMMHSGLSWAPCGLAQFAQPLLLEEVVHSFPTLRLVIAHFGWPWVAEAVMLALKHRNVYLDTSIIYSGTPAEALHHVLVDQVGCEVLEQSLRHQVLFGSNYPRAESIKRVAQGMRNLGLSSSLEQQIFRENALRVLKGTGRNP